MFTVKRLCFYSAVALCAIISSVARAEDGLSLPPGALVQVNKALCGFVNGSWTPGALLKSGNFLPTSTSVGTVKKKLKNKKLSSAAKLKLNNKLTKLKQSLKTNSKLCKTVPVGTPTPVATPASPLPGHVSVAWNATAYALQANIGSDYLYFCPANPFETIPTIYGHDIYTSDSAICVAAVHLGLFTRGTGGNVRIRIKGGLNFYTGSVRNGIESDFYGPYSGSYAFVDLASGAEILSGSIPQITWTRTAYRLYTYLGQQFTFVCPGGTNQGDSIWGTDIYTYDSSICVAAVHAGRITRANGGVVVVQILPGQSSYAASTRNGVTSSAYGSWGGSFSFAP